MTLRAALRAASVRRVIVVRHGNTHKAEVDADRQLTDKGSRQCDLFREHYAKRLSLVRLVLASSALRTMATAARVIAGPPPVAVDDLYFVRPWRTAEMVAGDSAIGYAPVARYLERYPGVYDAASEAMAGALAGAITSAIARAAPVDGDVLVASHAGYLSLLSLEIAAALAPEPAGAAQDAWLQQAREVVLRANVGEACAFELSAEGVRYLPNPEATDFAAAASNDAFVDGPDPKSEL